MCITIPPFNSFPECEVAGLLIEAGKARASENCVKQLMAVVNLLFEVMGCESPTKWAMVCQVRKGALKMRAPVVRRSRPQEGHPEVGHARHYSA